MDYPNSGNRLVSRVLFGSQSIAVSIYGLLAAIGLLSTNEMIQGVVIVGAVIAIDAIVVGLRLSTYFANHLSFNALALTATLVGVLGVGLTYPAQLNALPAGITLRSSILSLRQASQAGFVAFAIAFMACLVAIVVGAGQRRRN